jgi:hypothetical protein
VFNWEVAAVLLGILGTITVAIIRLVPQKTIIHAASGDKCATKDDIEALEMKLRDHDRYTKERNHDLLNAHALINASLQSISQNLAVVMDRGRRNNHDDV